MFDLIVIGAGSGGLVAAKRAASYGKKVMLCENDTIGGTCVSYGCVPKKLWHYIAHFKHAAAIAQDSGWDMGPCKLNWNQAQTTMRNYITQLNNRHETKCTDCDITIIRGHASFINESTININNQHYRAKDILISVGSTANTLNIPGSEHCDTSYEFFNWTEQPKRVGIIGGGYIAVELASILNALDTETHIIIRKEHVLRGFDQDIRTFLQDKYQKRGITIHSNTTPQSIAKHDINERTAKQKMNHELNIELSNNTTLSVDTVIQCIGRSPNTSKLNCEKAGVDCSNTGGIIVNDNYQSSNPNVHALGDCIDKEQLTPVAIAQARQWADMMYGKTPFKVSFNIIPTAIFSLPEAASVGLSEEDAKQRFDTVTTKKLSFNPLSVALTNDHKEPILMKLVLTGKDEHVVGIHMVGDGAAEIIQSLAVAVQKGITKEDLDATMALHPTVSEELVTIY